MFQRQIKSKAVRLLVLILACCGAAHFALSVYLWLTQVSVGLKSHTFDWTYFFTHSAPAYLLFALFVGASVLAWRSRFVAIPLTLVSLFLAAGCFLYDARHHYYQIQVMTESGCEHAYLAWIWYDDRHDPER
jgi:hypothetical protein